MRTFLVLAAMVLLVCSTSPAMATEDSVTRGFDAMQVDNEAQKRIQGVGAPQDTIDFGYYTIGQGGEKYAVPGETWTWDHAASDPLEGWTSVDQTAQIGTFFRWMTAARWADEQNPGLAPGMNGVGFVLAGGRKGYGDSLGWSGGVGYGNEWCQRLTSPEYTYSGSGSVSLSILYFCETELDRDYTRIYVEYPWPTELTDPNTAWSGSIGINSATGAITPALYTHSIRNAELGDVYPPTPRPFTIVIEFTSNGAWSDEDGFNSWYGAVGVDDITVENNITGGRYFYDFESDILPWVASPCPGVGSFMEISGLSQYAIQDPCACDLTGNVLMMHDWDMMHPNGQHETLYSPIVDRENAIPQYLEYKRVFADFDQYADLPFSNGVFYRTGWTYYPYDNPRVPGYTVWSPRVGIGTFYYTGGIPICSAQRNVGTDWGLPPDCKQIKFIYEIWSSCAAFGVNVCSGVTNFSPLIDNVRIRTSRGLAPAIFVDTGTKFQDGFGQSPIGVLSTTDAGNSNIVYDLRRGGSWQPRLGDSLVVGGPEPRPGATSTTWEAKLWFRLNRIGPGQAGNALYTQWHSAVAAQKGDFVGANANFAWGYMDMVQTGTRVKSNSSYRFCSRFRDGPPADGHWLPPDVNYNWGGGGPFSNGNAILPDLCFTPGTKVQYFMTANYVSTPTSYGYLPDTTGKNYYEFEILPSFRNVEGVAKLPCTLYIDGCDGRGRLEAQYIIEHALNIKMNGLLSTDPIPDPTIWDRYDYGDGSSNWNAAFYRNIMGNNGAAIPQMLGYQSIIVNTGNLDAQCMEARDWYGFENWLTTPLGFSNTVRQSFIANGNSIGRIISWDYPQFLTQYLGATINCSPYNAVGCPSSEALLQNDTNICVGLQQQVGYFNLGIPTDLFANWCPAPQSYGVLNVNPAVPNAAGNKRYDKINANPAVTVEWAQVINDQLTSPNKYRSVIDDFSYDNLVEADACSRNPPVPSRISAAAKELENALKWTNGSVIPPLCDPPAFTGAPEQEGASAAVTRLYQNRPNPFNPRTAIRFSLAADGPARLIIYDVSGRRIRTLVQSGLKAGMHEVVWDGTDDTGHTVTSGVYWSQLHAGDYSSNKKMVVLK